PQFDPASILELIETERGTFLPGVPTMLLRVLEHPDFAARDLSSLTRVSTGGTAVPAELVRRGGRAPGGEEVRLVAGTPAGAGGDAGPANGRGPGQGRGGGPPAPPDRGEGDRQGHRRGPAARGGRGAVRARLSRHAWLLRHAGRDGAGDRRRRLAAYRRPRVD